MGETTSHDHVPLDHPSVTTRPFPMRRPLYPRTQTQIKRMIKREEVLSGKIKEYVSDRAKEIWDAEYMTTSDEEDNDSEPEERLEDLAENNDSQWPNQLEKQAEAKKRV